jgi:hypothetical protein
VYLVGEEVVSFPRQINALPEGAGEKDALKANGYFERPPRLSFRHHLGAINIDCIAGGGLGGPTMFARIGMMRALNRNRVRFA